MKKTKIVCTIGPATKKVEILKEIINMGMDVARINFSHGSHSEHKETIEMVRQASKELSKPIGIMLDTRGPEIRIGTFKNSPILLKQGDDFTLTSQDIEGTQEGVSITYKELPKEISPGSRILMDDGLISMIVERTDGTNIYCKVEIGGELSNRKGVNIPNFKLNLPAITEKDLEDILFGIGMDVDFIAASFIRKSEDVIEIRKILEDNGAGHIKIISKIESQEGVDNLDMIGETSDGIMVARGDLGVEIPAEEVPLVQKRIICLCNRLGKPVITATQMLDSMIRNPRPTRAEANDVANAIFDGTDAVMLSGETAAGKYPVESVEMMAKIALRTEKEIKQREWAVQMGKFSVTDTMSSATCSIAKELNTSAIITSTKSGYTARMVSRYKPEAFIIAVTPEERVVRNLTLTWGVVPLQVKPTESTDEMIEVAVEGALKTGVVKMGDQVVVTAGIPVNIAGTTNLLKVHVIGEVILKGIGIGKRSICGPVKIVGYDDDPNEKVKAGDIVVTPATDANFIQSLKKASGLITEEGGLTSHGAIVGLNLGIPVVVGVDGAATKLKDGQIITLDVECGLIYRGKTAICN